MSSGSMAYNSAAGLSGMLSSGTKHFSQDDDNDGSGVVLRNIDACLQLSRMLSTSLGPQGRCKLVQNHLGKLCVTSDCASILKEIDIEHPAARLVKIACEKQQVQYGDTTNFILAFAGELLWQTCLLIQKMTWKPAPEIIAGYQHALKLCCEEYLPKLTVINDSATNTNTNNMNREHLLKVLRPILASKQYGSEHILAPLVADACLMVISSSQDKKKVHVPVEAVRTIKLIGSSVTQSMLLPGFIAKTGVDTVCKQVSGTQIKVAVYACGFEASTTEAKGTVLMKNANDLLNYNISEETKMEEIVTSIVNTGVQVIVTGGNISDMALHFLDKFGIVCLRLSSKWELRRLCQAVSATALVRLGPPTPDELGVCSSAKQQEIGGKTVTIFTTSDTTDNKSNNKIATIVLRASTHTVLNDLERAVDDGVQAVANLFKDGGRLVYGGGAIEMALSVKLQNMAAKTPGLEQYSLSAFGKALEIIPRTLAENAGCSDPTQVLADMQALHANKTISDDDDDTICDIGVDIREGSTGKTASMKEQGVVDLLVTKLSALQLAVDAVVTILKIDQIIMSKPAGGPKPP